MAVGVLLVVTPRHLDSRNLDHTVHMQFSGLRRQCFSDSWQRRCSRLFTWRRRIGVFRNADRVLLSFFSLSPSFLLQRDRLLCNGHGPETWWLRLCSWLAQSFLRGWDYIDHGLIFVYCIWLRVMSRSPGTLGPHAQRKDLPFLRNCLLTSFAERI